MIITVDMFDIVKKALNPSYARSHGMWAKKLTGVAEKAKTGHDYEGEWLPRGGRLHDVEVDGSAVYLFCGDFGSVKNHKKEVGIFVFRDGEFQLVGQKAYGRDWAIKLRETAREALNGKKEVSVFDQFTTAELIEELKKRGIKEL